VKSAVHASGRDGAYCRSGVPDFDFTLEYWEKGKLKSWVWLEFR
jgi:hypothetical protein